MRSPIPDHLNPYGKKFILFQLVFWFLYFFIHRSLWFSYTPPPISWTFTYMATGWFSTSMLAITIWATRKASFKYQMLVGAIGSIVFGVLWRVNLHAIEWHVIDIFRPEVITPFAYVHNGFFATIHLLAWTAGYFLIAYYSKYLHQQERAAKAELLAKEAQIKLLHLQISPHFLFNVLNSLDTLLMKENITESREMLSKLSVFLRQTLSEEPTHNIPLREEIERTKSYLDIELVRFGDKLAAKWSCDPRLDEFMVPSLILQPLVENAIKHCVGKSMHGGTIEIEADYKDNAIELAVINKSNGDEQIDERSIDGLGIGLDNIKSRLELQFGKKAALRRGPNLNGGYEVRIIIERDYAEYTS